MPRVLSTINHQLSTRRKALILALFCAAVIGVFVLIPRGPALELYTTPPLDSKGTRIQLLIPRGWGAKANANAFWYAYSFEPMEPLPWLPAWARRLLHANPEPDAAIYVSWDTSDGTVTDDFCVIRNGNMLPHVSRGQTVPGRGFWQLNYNRSDAQAFKATHSTILDSVKVL